MRISGAAAHGPGVPRGGSNPASGWRVRLVVCLCKGLTETGVREAIRSGARTVGDLSVRCGAGSECGGCSKTLESLLEQSPPSHSQGQGRASGSATCRRR
jgi:bacterioferritin-associated ferredoxin